MQIHERNAIVQLVEVARRNLKPQDMTRAELNKLEAALVTLVDQAPDVAANVDGFANWAGWVHALTHVRAGNVGQLTFDGEPAVVGTVDQLGRDKAAEIEGKLRLR